MKTTDKFKQSVQEHLNYRGFSDPLFAKTLAKPNKNIDDCCTYILNQVQKSGCNGFEDAEIFAMAVHFYDEDDIKPGDKFSGKVVVNHKVVLTAEEKAEAKAKALEQVVAEEKAKLRKKTNPRRTTKEEIEKVTPNGVIDLFGN